MVSSDLRLPEQFAGVASESQLPFGSMVSSDSEVVDKRGGARFESQLPFGSMVSSDIPAPCGSEIVDKVSIAFRLDGQFRRSGAERCPKGSRRLNCLSARWSVQTQMAEGVRSIPRTSQLPFGSMVSSDGHPAIRRRSRGGVSIAFRLDGQFRPPHPERGRRPHRGGVSIAFRLDGQFRRTIRGRTSAA